MNLLLSWINVLPDLSLPDREVKSLLYADDLVLVSPTEQGLQQQLDIVEKYGQIWTLTANMKKTNIMIFQKRPRCQFTINNRIIELTISYTYLGVLHTPLAFCEEDLPYYASDWFCPNITNRTKGATFAQRKLAVIALAECDLLSNLSAAWHLWMAVEFDQCGGEEGDGSPTEDMTEEGARYSLTIFLENRTMHGSSLAAQGTLDGIKSFLLILSSIVCSRIKAVYCALRLSPTEDMTEEGARYSLTIFLENRTMHGSSLAAQGTLDGIKSFLLILSSIVCSRIKAVYCALRLLGLKCEPSSLMNLPTGQSLLEIKTRLPPIHTPYHTETFFCCAPLSSPSLLLASGIS
ncbi:hypothetical protein F2P81_019863 [Scophthalmus maximus]|uniref:Reverse transcriptase domain-containing protein n=1 Tax=Scophthalmus maximus TaxID=52904 RepID=A0A6A4S7E4_SCOMX|nr:hypothetical protein F2P81_019863 [Scophthalmus maximus]